MTEEIRSFFWAITLDSNKTKDSWDPEKNLGPQGDATKGDHRLSVKQIMIEAEARGGEANVVEIETVGYKAQAIKFPISITEGKRTQVSLNFLFPNPPVTFRLVKGIGPVHLLGNHTIYTTEEDIIRRASEALDDSVEFIVVDDQEDSEEQEDSERNKKDNKRSISQSNNTKIRKRAKCD